MTNEVKQQPILVDQEQAIVEILSQNSSQGASTRQKSNKNTVHYQLIFEDEELPPD